MRNHWLIVLRRSLTTNDSDGQFTVAHELAHARLKHLIFDGNLLAEEQADDLVRSWGFEIPKYRYKVHREHRRAMERNAAAASAGK